MDESDFFGIFERYGVDTVLVAFLVVLGMWALKNTLLKKRLPVPVRAVLPFVFGIAVFALLQCVLHPSLEFLRDNARLIVQRGLTAGGLSTLECAVISRFLGKKPLPEKASVVRELLADIAEGEALDALSVKIADCVSEEYSDGGALRVAETLKDFTGGSLSESDLNTLALLIVQTLKTTAE